MNRVVCESTEHVMNVLYGRLPRERGKTPVRCWIQLKNKHTPPSN